MTGYGQARYEDEHFSVSVEVKTLNSKFLDVAVRIPKSYSDKEIPLRNFISEKLERGKVSLMLEYSNKQEAVAKVRINEALFKEYFKNHPNEELNHGPVVDWVTDQWLKDHDLPPRDLWRAIRKLHQEGWV